MGSGRGGGGGGGSGGGGSGGGGGGNFGGYRMEKGRVVSVPPKLAALRDAVRGAFTKLSQEYLLTQFASPLVRAIYAELFLISVDLVQSKSWANIEKRHGVSGGPGCLSRLAAALMKLEEENEYKARKHVGMALENFLMRAVGDDPASLLRFTGDQVVRNIQPAVFKRTSNEFFGELVYQVLMSEPDAVPPDAEVHLRDVACETADRAIAGFEARFLNKEQATYRQVAVKIAERPAWFIEALRR
jgi:hypothetical protein